MPEKRQKLTKKDAFCGLYSEAGLSCYHPAHFFVSCIGKKISGKIKTRDDLNGFKNNSFTIIKNSKYSEGIN